MPNLSKNAARTASPGEITLLLRDRRNPESLRTVMRLAYGEMHGIAVGYCRRERPGRTLTATAVLNESCVRLLEAEASFKNRRHFFGAAAQAMRQVLVDNARSRKAQKRGGGWTRVEFREAERIGFEQPSDLLDFNTALSHLEADQPLWGEVVKLRVFGGCSTAEAAVVLGIASSTARRRWTRAKRLLRKALANSAKAAIPRSEATR